MSADFNGTSSHLTAWTDNLGVTAYPFSIAYWVKIDTLAIDGMFEYKNNNGSAKIFRGYQINTSGTYRTTVVQSATVFYSLSSNLSTATWYPIVHTFNTNDLYTESSGSNTGSSTTTQSYSTNASPRFTMGRDFSNGTFDGKIAHFTVWNVELSTANISSFINANNPDNIDQANQTRYWPLTGSAPSLTDERNSITLTASNMTYSTDDPTISSGGKNSNLLLLGVGN